MARCHFIKCPQDTHASRIEIAFEPSSAPGMPAAFFGGTVLAGQEPRGERIIIDYTEFLLPADRLEFGFELPAVRKICRAAAGSRRGRPSRLLAASEAVNPAGVMLEAPMGGALPAAMSCA